MSIAKSVTMAGKMSSMFLEIAHMLGPFGKELQFVLRCMIFFSLDLCRWLEKNSSSSFRKDATPPWNLQVIDVRWNKPGVGW